MADLSGETVSSEAETSDNWSDKQSDEELSACLKGTYWSRLPVEMQIEIVKQKNLDNGDKLNLLCAYPELLSVINESYPRENPIAANGGEDTEGNPPRICIEYSSKAERFYDHMAGFLDARQPPRIFGLKHNQVMFVGLNSGSKHAAILLDALESTSTTTQNLDFDANEVDFQMVLAFIKVLKPSYLKLDFNNKKWSTLNELVEACPAFFELNELTMLGPVYADDNSLLSHLSKFPPSVCFNNMFSSAFFEGFLHTEDAVKFLRTLVSTKFEEGSAAAIALKRIVNWTFQMSHETKEGEAKRDYKFLSELIADIIPPDSENERDTFKLHLSVGGEQHVIYVKEEVNHRHEYRLIQLANQIENLYYILDSPDGSIISNLVEEMSSSDSDPDSDMVDSDEEGDEFVDDDH